MKKQLNIIKIQFLFTASLYLFIYLFRSFCVFEFTNPFQWIIDIPSYTKEDRGLILFGFIFYHSFVYGVVYCHITDLSKTLKNK